MPPSARRLTSGYRDSADRAPRLPAQPTGTPFAAELELAELDDRRRPGALWSGRAVEISRSHITLRSRRMCYNGRSVVVIVHLVDDRPAALFGTVRECEYDSDGLYKTRLDLAPLPDEPGLAAWLRDHDARGNVCPTTV